MSDEVAATNGDKAAVTESLKEIKDILKSQLGQHKDLWDLIHFNEVIDDDNLLRRYMRRRGGRVEQTVAFISSALTWRKEIGLSSLTDQSFPSEFYKANGMFVYGEDIKRNAVLYIRVANTFNSPEIAPLVKKFIAYQLWKADQLGTKNGQEAGWIQVFECSNAGLRNADTDLLSYINTVLKEYFPSGQKYILVVNLNWFLKAIKTLAFTWWPAAVKKRIHFCSTKEISEYIPIEKLPDFLGGPESATEYKKIPKDCLSLDDMRKNGDIVLDDEAYQRGIKFIEKACV